MLIEDKLRIRDVDVAIFERLVPPDHLLRQALTTITWDQFGEELAQFYVPDRGRPAIKPVMMLKFELLRYAYGLSDRGVIERATTDMAFRMFLEVGLYYPLPDPSSLSVFRGRIGQEGFLKVFQCLVAQARQKGLIKDRLRIKDATHVIADIAVPTALALVARVRNKLLLAVDPFDPVRVQGERINLELLRQREEVENDQQRLASRVDHLRDILAWVDELKDPPQNGQPSGGQLEAWRHLTEIRALAHKILFDRDNPGNQTLSDVDPDARCGKHHQWFDGYLVDALMDADSELITQINVFPANDMRSEIDDTIELVRREEEEHGNDIEKLSVDGIAHDGPLLRELQDPDNGLTRHPAQPAAGCPLDLYIPPRKSEKATYTSDRFVRNDDNTVTCPAGQRSYVGTRNHRNNGWTYRFNAGTCSRCPLIGKCINRKVDSKRTVAKVAHKSDYEAEFRRIREKATTPEYAAVRKEHPKIERKLSELMNRYRGRRARVRGLPKVTIGQLMGAFAANIARMMRLLNTGALPAEA